MSDVPPSRQPGRRSSGISHADVPHHRPWHKLFVEPIVLASNLAMFAWIWPAWKMARTEWHPPIDELATLQSQGRPLIYYTWHAYEPLAVFACRDLPADIRPTAIGHDGTKSRMLQRGFHWLGVDVWVYRRRSSISPKQQIINFIKAEHPHLALAADAGGPYGVVRGSLTDLARAGDAYLLPFVVTGKRILRTRWPTRYYLPTPFSTITFHFANPLDGRTATRDDCQNAIDELEDRIGRKRSLSA